MKTQLTILLAASALTFTACDKPADPEAEAPATEETAPEANTEEAPAEEPAAAAAEEKPAEEAMTATVGKPAPDFELPDEEGKAHKLSDLKGSIVVLEWTNPECPVVQRVYDANMMQKAIKEVSGTEVKWLAIDSSNFVKPEDSKKWKDANKADWPHLQDPSGSVGKLYGAKTTPHMFVVDKEGVLQYGGAIDNDPHGKIDEKERKNFVVEAVNSIAKGEPVADAETKPYGCSVKYGS